MKDDKKKGQDHLKAVEDSINEMFNKSPLLNAIKDVNNKDKLSPTETVKVHLNKIFPRLKGGHVEKAPLRKATYKINGEDKEISIPKSHQLYGIDLGPDFCCCFALDIGANFQLLTNNHFENSPHSKKEFLNIACGNFLREYGSKIQLQSSMFPGVYMLKIDGNTEASTFLFSNLWDQIKEKQNFKKLHLLMPLQDILLCWDEINEDLFQEVIRKIEEIIKEQPGSRRISNHIYEYSNNSFTDMGKVINLSYS